jgi:hypothetical protein
MNFKTKFNEDNQGKMINLVNSTLLKSLRNNRIKFKFSGNCGNRIRNSGISHN